MVSSDLDRARSTATRLGDPELAASWRELDFGEWEGLRWADFRRRLPADAEALLKGRPVSAPGGETSQELERRLTASLHSLVDRLDDGDRAIVVTHGLVVHTVVSSLLGLNGAGLIGMPANASMTTVRIDRGDKRTLAVLNDTAHLDGSERTLEGKGTTVHVFRHGQTEANVTGHWQGRSPGVLSAAGKAQAELLAASAPAIDRMYSSPLARARDTAEALASSRGLEVGVVDDLAEMDFGGWEGLTREEAKAEDTALFDEIYCDGVDRHRGRSGETFAEVGTRMAVAVAGLVEDAGACAIGLVSHGGATRAYVAHLLGLPFADRERLAIVRNTGTVRIVYGRRGPVVSSYNVAWHLEG